MLISSMLGAAAIVSLSADPAVAPRIAFGRCLRLYVEKATEDRMSKSAFAREFPRRCQSEEQALREAIRAKEAAAKTPADDIEKYVAIEIEDLRSNWQTRFEDSL